VDNAVAQLLRGRGGGPSGETTAALRPRAKPSGA